MSVFKRYNRKRVTADDPNWSKGTWYVLKRIKGKPRIYQAIPEARTQKQAEKAELALIAAAFSKQYEREDRTVTFYAFADTTYRDYIEQKNVNKKAKIADLNIFLKFFGKRKLLSEITVKDCRDLQYRLVNTPTYYGGVRSASTVNRTMSSLSRIFSLACEEELLKRNPMQHVASLDEPPPRQRLLTPEQKNAFWNEVSKDVFMFRIVMLGVNMPVRCGQILALKKEDCVLAERKVFVITSKGRKRRPIPLNAAALQILSEMCAEVESGPLITYKGKPIRSFRTRWRKLLIRAKINKLGGTREENFHFHDLRTEFASELLRHNVNPEIVRRLFDHSSMQITQGYISTEDDILFDAVNTLPVSSDLIQ